MVSYKSVLNQNIKGHILSDAEIKDLQKCLIAISGEINEVCKKYNIKLILQGGSLLGQIRHNGFIPWDDDIDFGMMRADYEKFISIFDEELSDRYILSAPKKQYDSYNRFIQLFRKNTFYDDGGLEICNRPQNISIDIFPLDFAPNNKFIRRIKGIWANILMAIGGAVDTKVGMTSKLKEVLCLSKSGKLQYRIRMMIGCFFSWRTPKQWFECIDKFISCNNESKYITSGTGRKHYLGEVIPADSVLPLQTTIFEGLDVYKPARPDVYLTNLYGDYMTIPQPEKREKHFVVSIKTL